MATLELPGNISVEDQLDSKFTTPASIISELLKYIFPFAGLVLFFMLIAGGFQLLTAAGNEESIKKGQQRILYAVIGFMVIFISFWLIQILEVILGIEILNLGQSEVGPQSIPFVPDDYY
ncbi:hypothetical protein COT75_02600 [Candidatus Beckwithbacteria bacterium CG10_big_fil_rev_8_21_14_0_10_34_10]|uniref:Uncharacterized protein n=1 Tax=Candidatus Beckwithbacteria bacterium CG10_big_fil_rev_8_21_14_0_10_34_10 TaxID=1974495 RepID=A0A2H0W9A8_9BACT|nr:MAG: hypothetical protein COT75_02600 [Candidatus Beckwithbacteria bacterium CG10_big_fil_rev_8_21_14_0_10_34_10]